MDDKIQPYSNNEYHPITVQFILNNNDSITISGNSVCHVFFETLKRYPETFSYKAIGFVADSKEESDNYLKQFFILSKKYGKI